MRKSPRGENEPNLASVRIPDPSARPKTRADPGAPGGGEFVIRGLSVRYGESQVLHDLAFDWHAGRVHALIGPNGSGKSTVVKALAGVVQPLPTFELQSPGGKANANATAKQLRDLGIRAVHQNLGLIPEMPVVENLYLGNDLPRTGVPSPLVDSTPHYAASAGICWPRHRARHRVDDLPPSSKVLLAVARALLQLPPTGGLLLVDEPTAALDEGESQRLLTRLRQLALNQQLCVVLITHRLREVLQSADDVTVLRDGKVVYAARAHETDAAALLTALGAVAGPDPTKSDRDEAPRAFGGADRMSAAPVLELLRGLNAASEAAPPSA